MRFTSLTCAFLIAFSGSVEAQDGKPKRRRLKAYKAVEVSASLTPEQVHNEEWEEAVAKPQSKTLIHRWENLLQTHTRTKNLAILKAVAKDGKKPRPIDVYQGTFAVSELVFDVKDLRPGDEIVMEAYAKDSTEPLTVKKISKDGKVQLFLRNPGARSEDKAIDRVEVSIVSKAGYYYPFQYHTLLESTARVPGIPKKKKPAPFKRVSMPKTYCPYDAKRELGGLDTTIREISTPLKVLTDEEKFLSTLSPEEQKEILRLKNELETLQARYTSEDAVPSLEYVTPEDKALLEKALIDIQATLDRLAVFQAQLEAIQAKDPNLYKTAEDDQLRKEIQAEQLKLRNQIADLQRQIAALKRQNEATAAAEVKTFLTPDQLKLLKEKDVAISTANKDIASLQKTIEDMKKKEPEIWKIIEENSFVKEIPPEDVGFLFDVSNSMYGNPYNAMIFTVEYTMNLVDPKAKVSVERMYDGLVGLRRSDVMIDNKNVEEVGLDTIYKRLKDQFVGSFADNPAEGLSTLLQGTQAKDIYVFGDGNFSFSDGKVPRGYHYHLLGKNAGDKDHADKLNKTDEEARSYFRAMNRKILGSIVDVAQQKGVRIHFVCVSCDTNESFSWVSQKTGGTFSKVDSSTLNPELARQNMGLIRENFQKVTQFQRDIANLKLKVSEITKERQSLLDQGEAVRQARINETNQKIIDLQTQINSISHDIDSLARKDVGIDAALDMRKQKEIDAKKAEMDAQNQEELRLQREAQGVRNKGDQIKQGVLKETQSEIDQKAKALEDRKAAASKSHKPVKGRPASKN